MNDKNYIKRIEYCHTMLWFNKIIANSIYYSAFLVQLAVWPCYFSLALQTGSPIRSVLPTECETQLVVPMNQSFTVGSRYWFFCKEPVVLRTNPPLIYCLLHYQTFKTLPIFLLVSTLKL